MAFNVITNLKRLIIQGLRSQLSRIGISFLKTSTLHELENNSMLSHDIKILTTLKDNGVTENYFKSKSQLRQDLFVLSHLKFKRDGFFVEFGATNGVDLSNTYLLEKEFGWKGILAEPAIIWHKDLRMNRSCLIEDSCVWSNTGEELIFTESQDPELSTLTKLKLKDSLRYKRLTSKEYLIRTISLTDLLRKFQAPSVIDYLSIDTEGSEYEILKSFDFQNYKFQVITCEHNFSQDRNKVYSLLSKNGYKRVYEDLSNFDDWYVLDA
jgi:FkbM family methyltransferase